MVKPLKLGIEVFAGILILTWILVHLGVPNFPMKVIIVTGVLLKTKWMSNE